MASYVNNYYVTGLPGHASCCTCVGEPQLHTVHMCVHASLSALFYLRCSFCRRIGGCPASVTFFNQERPLTTSMIHSANSLQQYSTRKDFIHLEIVHFICLITAGYLQGRQRKVMIGQTFTVLCVLPATEIVHYNNVFTIMQFLYCVYCLFFVNFTPHPVCTCTVSFKTLH